MSDGPNSPGLQEAQQAANAFAPHQVVHGIGVAEKASHNAHYIVRPFQKTLSLWLFCRGIHLNDIFGNLCEGMPKTTYYRLITASHASTARLFSRRFKTLTAPNASFGIYSIPSVG